MVAILLISAAFPVRFSVPGVTLATASVFDIVLLSAVLPYIFVLASGRRLPVGPAPLFQLGMGLVALSVASLAWTQSSSDTLTGIFSAAEGVFGYLLVVGFLRDAPPSQIVRLLYQWVILLLIPAVLLWQNVPGFLPPSTVDPLSGDYISYFARLSHPFLGRSNNLATLLVFAIVPLGVWAALRRDRRAGLVALISFAATLLTFSRGVLLALVLAVALFALFDWTAARPVVSRILIATVPSTILLWAALRFNDDVARFLPDRFTAAGSDARLQLVESGIIQFLDNWILGVGASVGEPVHNTYLQQVVYFGVAGGFFAIGLFIVAGLSWFTREPPSELRNMRRAVGIAFLAQLLTFVTESSFEGTLLKPLIWICWGLGAALVAAFEKESLSPETQDDLRFAGHRRSVN